MPNDTNPTVLSLIALPPALHGGAELSSRLWGLLSRVNAELRTAL